MLERPGGVARTSQPFSRRTPLSSAPHTRAITTSNWHIAFTNAGNTLRALREAGTLTRGKRAITTKFLIFHWIGSEASLICDRRNGEGASSTCVMAGYLRVPIPGASRRVWG